MAINGAIIHRLVWKELRLLGPFWAAMAVLTIFLELVAAAVSPRGDLTALFMVAIGLPAFHGLGCGATMFAAEHEAGTYDFLRGLPLKPAELLVGKLAFATISTPLLFLVCWLAAVGLSRGQLPSAGFLHGAWGLWGFAWVELLVWGMLFSLLLKQPMKAAMLGAAGASWSVFSLASQGNSHLMGMGFYAAVLPSRMAVAAAIGLVDVWLTLRWLGEKRVRSGEVAGEAAASGPTGPGVAGGWETSPSRASAFGRLVWLQWRQSRSMIAILSLMVAPILLGTVSVVIRATLVAIGFHHVSLFSDFRHTGELSPLFLLAAVIAVPIAGASVFMADQRQRQFRFLANRGVRPGAMWLSRHLVWALVLAVWLVGPGAALVSMTNRALLNTPSRQWNLLQAAGAILACVVAAYAVGQLWSMFLKSSILAGTAAVACTVALSAWMELMFVAGVDLWWSVVPIPLLLLAATRLRASGWLLERNTLGAWLPVVLVLVVPGVAIVSGVCVYRVVEIPLVEPGFSVEEFTRPASPEARRTAEMYRRASRLENKQAAIAMVMEASRRPACDAFEPNGPPEPLPQVAYSLSHMLRKDAERLQRQGELDAALERYLAVLRMANQARRRAAEPSWYADLTERNVYDALADWAAQPGQTPERIAAAVKEIAELTSAVPSRADQVKSVYVRMSRIFDGDLADIMAGFHASKPRSWGIAALYMLPWERARGRRELNYLVAKELKRIREAETAVARGEYVELRFQPVWPHPPPWTLATSVMNQLWWGSDMLLEQEWDVLVWRRATLLRLALKAWEREHGELPRSLDPLVGTYLKKMPIDPYAGEPFRYFRQGLPVALTERDPRLSGKKVETLLVAAGKPLVWSVGKNLRVTARKEPVEKYRLRSEPRHRFITEVEIWSRGLPFPLP